jgi:endoglucanase
MIDYWPRPKTMNYTTLIQRTWISATTARMVRPIITIFLACTLIVASAWLLHSQPVSTSSRTVQLTGVNIAGAEFNPQLIPGIYGQHYFYPDPSNVDYFATKGMNVIRLPVLWERLQRQLQDKLDETEIARVDAVVTHITAKGMMVIIDVHNYAKYSDAVIGSENLPAKAFADLWYQIAERYKDNRLVAFGLMNEPQNMRTETWLMSANAAIAEIRRSGAKNLILVSGNGWSSARDWLSNQNGLPNSVAMRKLVDPIHNYMIEVHQYLDRDYSGTNPECQHVDVGVESLVRFTQWARINRKRAFLGEFGAGPDAICLEALDRMLKYMADNRDVWHGWTYWAAGAWWHKDFHSNLEPLDGQEPRPQMLVLDKYARNAEPAKAGSR